MTRTRQRLIIATLAVIGRVGITRMTLEVVAAEAGLSRQTVYRHFGSRDGLLEAVVRYESEGIRERVRRAGAEAPDDAERLVRGFAEALCAVRDHALLRAILDSEPESLLPLLVASHGPAVEVAATIARELLADAPVPHAGRAIDVMTRLIISYAITPPEDDPDAVAREVLETMAGLALV